MKKSDKKFVFLILLSVLVGLLVGRYSAQTDNSHFTYTTAVAEEQQQTPDKAVVYESDSIIITSEIVEPAPDNFSLPLVTLSVQNKNTGNVKPIFTTVRNTNARWYVSDGKDFQPIPIDSLVAASRVYVLSEEPLTMIVEGCPDARNDYSYYVNADDLYACYVPANSGFFGRTEEKFMIFASYRYSSEPEEGGRHTFLQVYNQRGIMVDSLDLERAGKKN